MHKLKYLLLSLLIIFFYGSKSQSLRPYIKNYTTKDYGKVNHQSWSVSQNEKGLVYFGKSLKLLEFDGENWNKINTSAKGGNVISILPDSSSRIYIGAIKEFGYLFPNEKGEYVYKSLTDSIDEKDKPFGNVWKTLNYNNGVVFFTQENIYFYKNDSIQIIKPNKLEGQRTTFHNIFVVDNKLYVRQRGIGLMIYENNKFKLLPNGDIFKLYGVFGMYKNLNSNNILISTQEVGFYNLTSDSIEKIETTDETVLNSSAIFGGITLNDGNIALNTAHNGVIIIDFKANIKNVFNKELGLLDNDVKQIYQDKEGNLWLAMNSGLAKINYSSQISYYKEKSGLSGRVKSITKFNNIIFVGTSDGLYIEDTIYPFYQKKFFRLPSINDGVLSISKSENNLFIGTKNALYLISKNYKNTILIDRIDASSTYWSEKKKLLYVVGDNGLAIYQKQSNSFIKIAYDDWSIVHNITSLVEEQNTNNESISLWAGSLNEGIINYKIDKKFNIIFDVYAGANDGLDEGWTKVFKHNNSFVVANGSGLMNFIDAKTINADIKDSSLIQDRGMFNFSDLYKNTATYTNFVEQNNLIWSCIDGNIILQNKKDTNIIKAPFRSVNFETIVILFPETENKLWVGADKGIAFIDLDIEKDFKAKPNINIRKVTVGTDSVLFCGLFIDNINNIVISKQENNIPVIEYALNNISIKFASIFEENGEKAVYSFKLDGYDSQWSEWGSDNTANYKKIASGTYNFLVKSKDIYGNESEIAEYKFIINPPWYNTVWAYIVYFILFIAIVYLVVMLSIKRLKAKNEELESIVQERTKEISKQRDILAEQKQEIEDSINYAKRIQQAVLPHDEYIEKIINDFFILFRPKDIVSGDFYWALKIEGKIIITAADCTGHGVPGAFMSMLGMSFLHQIVRIEKHTHAHDILNSLRIKIIEALKQKGVISEQKDGMDMALCVIDTKTNKVEFSGANNPLYIVTKANKLNINSNSTVKLNENLLEEHNGFNLFEVKPNKMPIAIYVHMEDFNNNEIQLEKGDCIYMFSDGFADQFGGKKGKKFKYKPFKKLILGNSQKPMKEQHELLEKSFVQWHEGYEQIDDVVVIGLRI